MGMEDECELDAQTDRLRSCLTASMPLPDVPLSLKHDDPALLQVWSSKFMQMLT